MHKKGKQNCTIYTVLRLRRGLTKGSEAEKGKKCITPAINKTKAQHTPARRTNQGARARLDRESAPSNCKRATGRHESSPHFYNIRGLTIQQIANQFQSDPAYTLTASELLDSRLGQNRIFTQSVRRKPRRPQSGKNINLITQLQSNHLQRKL